MMKPHCAGTSAPMAWPASSTTGCWLHEIATPPRKREELDRELPEGIAERELPERVARAIARPAPAREFVRRWPPPIWHLCLSIIQAVHESRLPARRLHTGCDHASGPRPFHRRADQVLEQFRRGMAGTVRVPHTGPRTSGIGNGKVWCCPWHSASRRQNGTCSIPPSLATARKNISLDPQTGKLGNTALSAEDRAALARMMQRFADAAAALLDELLPGYADQLQRARTSFRPAEIEGRSYSVRHDDRLLHVDAFPTRPAARPAHPAAVHQRRPGWRAAEMALGEPFAAYAAGSSAGETATAGKCLGSADDRTDQRTPQHTTTSCWGCTTPGNVTPPTRRTVR